MRPNKLIHNIMFATDKVASIKESRIRHNSLEWFDGEPSPAGTQYSGNIR